MPHFVMGLEADVMIRSCCKTCLDNTRGGVVKLLSGVPLRSSRVLYIVSMVDPCVLVEWFADLYTYLIWSWLSGGPWALLSTASYDPGLIVISVHGGTLQCWASI